MERTTEENTSVYDGEHLLKEIESNFKLIMKSLPSEIEDDLNTLYDKFITLIKGPEKEKIFEQY